MNSSISVGWFLFRLAGILILSGFLACFVLGCASTKFLKDGTVVIESGGGKLVVYDPSLLNGKGPEELALKRIPVPRPGLGIIVNSNTAAWIEGFIFRGEIPEKGLLEYDLVDIYSQPRWINMPIAVFELYEAFLGSAFSRENAIIAVLEPSLTYTVVISVRQGYIWPFKKEARREIHYIRPSLDPDHVSYRNNLYSWIVQSDGIHSRGQIQFGGDMVVTSEGIRNFITSFGRR